MYHYNSFFLTVLNLQMDSSSHDVYLFLSHRTTATTTTTTKALDSASSVEKTPSVKAPISYSIHLALNHPDKKKNTCTKNTLTLNTINYKRLTGKMSLCGLNTSVNEDHKPTSGTEHTQHWHSSGLCSQSWAVYLFECSLNHMEFTDVTKVGLQQQQQEVNIQRGGGAACRLV